MQNVRSEEDWIHPARLTREKGTNTTKTRKEKKWRCRSDQRRSSFSGIPFCTLCKMVTRKRPRKELFLTYCVKIIVSSQNPSNAMSTSFFQYIITSSRRRILSQAVCFKDGAVAFIGVEMTTLAANLPTQTVSHCTSRAVPSGYTEYGGKVYTSCMVIAVAFQCLRDA